MRIKAFSRRCGAALFMVWAMPIWAAEPVHHVTHKEMLPADAGPGIHTVAAASGLTVLQVRVPDKGCGN
jgi:hypothetical protein